MKVTFAKLGKLVELFGDGSDDNGRWIANVTNSVGADALGLANEDEDGNFVLQDFACDELEFTDEVYYNFAGSEHEQERFYASDRLVYKDKLTGELWVMSRDEDDDLTAF